METMKQELTVWINQCCRQRLDCYVATDNIKNNSKKRTEIYNAKISNKKLNVSCLSKSLFHHTMLTTYNNITIYNKET